MQALDESHVGCWSVFSHRPFIATHHHRGLVTVR